MLNLPPLSIMDQAPFWPWERFSAVFAPPADLLQRGWFHGHWRVARFTGAGRGIRVERDWIDRGPLSALRVFRDGDRTPFCTVSLDYDRAGRLVEVFSVDGGRRSRLDFQYDGRGRVVRETSVAVDADGGWTEVGVAESFHDVAGRIRRVVVRDRDGNLRECRLYNASGSRIVTRLYDREGRIESIESYSRDPLSRAVLLEETRFLLHEPSGEMRPECRRTDLAFYDESGGLYHRAILDERNRASGAGPARWCRVAREVVHYQGRAERPVSDRTSYFDQWREGNEGEIVYEIAIDYQYDRNARLVRTLTTESDLLLRTENRRLTLHDHHDPDTPVPPGTLGADDRLPDCRILHEYRPDGHLSRRRVFEGAPEAEIQTVTYS